MDLRKLQQICKELDLYNTPELNDVLYLQMKGFSNIGADLCLYHGVKALYLQSNGISKIENLEKLILLRSLYLQENLIIDMEGLSTLVDLDTLNLSNNMISKIDNIEKCSQLKTLHLSYNSLKTCDSIVNILSTPSIRCLDLSHNQLDDPAVIDILKQMPNLSVLYLKGNPCVSKISNYRKFVVSSLPNLKYLDDRPVFEDERLTADAWGRGGIEEERVEMRRIAAEQQEKNEKQWKFMDDRRREITVENENFDDSDEEKDSVKIEEEDKLEHEPVENIEVIESKTIEKIEVIDIEDENKIDEVGNFNHVHHIEVIEDTVTSKEEDIPFIKKKEEPSLLFMTQPPMNNNEDHPRDSNSLAF